MPKPAGLKRLSCSGISLGAVPVAESGWIAFCGLLSDSSAGSGEHLAALAAAGRVNLLLGILGGVISCCLGDPWGFSTSGLYAPAWVY